MLAGISPFISASKLLNDDALADIVPTGSQGHFGLFSKILGENIPKASACLWDNARKDIGV